MTKRVFLAVDNVKIDNKKVENVDSILVLENIENPKESKISIQIKDGGIIRMIGRLIYNKKDLWG